jgi:hypothetical protein
VPVLIPVISGTSTISKFGEGFITPSTHRKTLKHNSFHLGGGETLSGKHQQVCEADACAERACTSLVRRPLAQDDNDLLGALGWLDSLHGY